MRNMFLAALLLCTARLPVMAQSDSRPPDEPGNNERRRFFMNEGRGSGFGRAGRSSEQPSEEEWTEVTSFMKENSPKRWKMYQNAPETHQARLRGLIYAAWKNLDRIKNDDKDLYALRLRRLPVEDDIFGISAEIKRGGERASPELRKQLEAKVGEFVDLRHEERKLRIAKLEKTLAAERRELVEFDSRREKIVENRTREVEREGPSALTAEHMARRNDEEQPRSNGDASSTDAAPNDAANDATHNAQNAPRQLEKR